MYPDLVCQTTGGASLEPCKREVACNKLATNQFQIDWTSPNSISNWTTEAGLTCSNPAVIGAMGLIAFFAFALGALAFGGLIDTKGRKWSLAASCAIVLFAYLYLLV